MGATFGKIIRFRNNSRLCSVNMNSSKSNRFLSNSNCRLKEPKKQPNSLLFYNKGLIRLSLCLRNNNRSLEPKISNNRTKTSLATRLLNSNSPFIKLSLSLFSMIKLWPLSSPFRWKLPLIISNNKLLMNRIFNCRNFSWKPRNNYWKSKRKVSCMENRSKN